MAEPRFNLSLLDYNNPFPQTMTMGPQREIHRKMCPCPTRTMNHHLPQIMCDSPEKEGGVNETHSKDPHWHLGENLSNPLVQLSAGTPLPLIVSVGSSIQHSCATKEDLVGGGAFLYSPHPTPRLSFYSHTR